MNENPAFPSPTVATVGTKGFSPTVGTDSGGQTSHGSGTTPSTLSADWANRAGSGTSQVAAAVGEGTYQVHQRVKKGNGEAQRGQGGVCRGKDVAAACLSGSMC